jgi:hypothetical protein
MANRPCQPMQANIVLSGSFYIVDHYPANIGQPLNHAAMRHADASVAVMHTLKAIEERSWPFDECNRPEACAQSTHRKRPARRI